MRGHTLHFYCNDTKTYHYLTLLCILLAVYNDRLEIDQLFLFMHLPHQFIKVSS